MAEQSFTPPEAIRPSAKPGFLEQLVKPKIHGVDSFKREWQGKEVDVKGPSGRDSIRFRAPEWKTWLANTYGDTFEGNLENAALLMEAFSRGARDERDRHNRFVSPRIYFLDDQTPTSGDKGRIFYDGVNQVLIVTLQKLAKISTNIYEEREFRSLNTQEVTMHGTRLAYMTLAGVEETNHFFYFRKQHRDPEKSFAPDELSSDAEYEAQDHEYDALYAQLNFIYRHPKEFSARQKDLMRREIDEAGMVRLLAFQQGLSVYEYLQAKYQTQPQTQQEVE